MGLDAATSPEGNAVRFELILEIAGALAAVLLAGFRSLQPRALETDRQVTAHRGGSNRGRQVLTLDKLNDQPRS